MFQFFASNKKKLFIKTVSNVVLIFHEPKGICFYFFKIFKMMKISFIFKQNILKIYS